MKFLIWFLCAFIYALITTALNMAGIMLGGIPTALLAGGAFLLAGVLCKKWDAHKSSKRHSPVNTPITEKESTTVSDSPSASETSDIYSPIPLPDSEPLKQKNNRNKHFTKPFKVVAVVLSAVVLLGVVGALGYQCYTLTNSNIELTKQRDYYSEVYRDTQHTASEYKAQLNNYTREYKDLQKSAQTTTEQYNDLLSSYNEVKTSYDTLVKNYSTLYQEYTANYNPSISQTTAEQYNNLLSSYNEVKTSYDTLVKDYSTLYQLYTSSYNSSNAQSSALDKNTVLLLEEMLIVKNCIESYNYYDYNISTAFYKYLLNTNDGLNYIKDIKSELYNERWFGEYSDLSSWITINSTHFSVMDGTRLRNISSDLRLAFDKLISAWDNLYKSFSNNSMSDFYNRQFQNELQYARNYISNVSSNCEALITSCLNTINSHARETN